MKKLFLLCCFLGCCAANSQCNQEKTVGICNLLSIDHDNNNKPDGIVDLNDYLNGIKSGSWVDTKNLDVLNGNLLYAWKLKNATQVLDKNDNTSKQGYYKFILYNTDCGPTTPALTLYIEMMPFSGVALKKTNEISAVYCNDVRESSICKEKAFDLFEAFETDLPNHNNGTWEYKGTKPLASFDKNTGIFYAEIPYKSNVPDIRNKEFFDFTYTVKGVNDSNSVCGVSEMKTNIRVAVVRSASAGFKNRIRICEDDIINYVKDIDLRDDKYLRGEDKEGKWLYKQDTTNQITNEKDSKINLKEVFDKNINPTNSRFGVKKVSYAYAVETTGICKYDQSKIDFIFIERIRPFSQIVANTKKNEFCIGGNNLKQPVNLYDYLEFTKENGVTYDYPKDTKYNEWELVSSPLDSVEKVDPLWKGGVNKTAKATFDFSKINNNKQAGVYVFKYTVNTGYNDPKGILKEIIGYDCKGEPIYDSSKVCDTSTSATVTILIHPTLYPGENTKGLELCETKFKNPIDLLSLLNKDKDKGEIATTGRWTDIDNSNKEITNPFTLPTITGEKKTFNFKYTTTSDKGCIDSATLSFTVFATNKPGVGGDVEICKSAASFNLFEKLTNNPSIKGKWRYPDGSESTDNNLIIDPEIAKEGKYTYTTFEVKDTKDAKLCDGESAFINLKIATPYPGENTVGLEYCETFFNKSVDLTTLLTRANNKKIVEGKWFYLANNQEVPKIFTLPQLTGEKQAFNFEHRTSSNKGCTDSATLSFTVYRINTSGQGGKITLCTTENSVQLFSLLKGNPSNKGTWLLPDKTEFSGYDFKLDPSRAQSGDYTYKTPNVLNSKGNILCEGKEATLNITIEKVPSAGKDVENTVCASDLVADLSRFLQGANQGGDFYDEKGEKLSSSAVKLEGLEPNKTHIYTYKLPDAVCKGDQAIVKLNVLQLPTPIAKDQEFCVAKDLVTVEDLKVSGGNGYDYEWFVSETSSIPLSVDTMLQDGKEYYVAFKDIQNCSSKRVKIKVTFTPLNTKGCNTCIGGSVSPNGDGINDVLSLCNLTNVYPSFEMTIHNRYGVTVYKGNRTTPPFDGTSSSGSQLPSGVYFYVFTPNDGKTKPIQGDFYLGR